MILACACGLWFGLIWFGFVFVWVWWYWLGGYWSSMRGSLDCGVWVLCWFWLVDGFCLF